MALIVVVVSGGVVVACGVVVESLEDEDARFKKSDA